MAGATATALLATLVTGIAVGSSLAQASPLAPDPITRVDTAERVVALTFDAGANAAGIPSILRTLRRHGVPATFFLTGAWVRTYPEETRRIAARGHALGNHTDTHPHVPQISDRTFMHQVRVTERAVRDVTGRSTKPLFRFPFGEYAASDVAIATGLGFRSIGWTVDTAGWLGRSGGQSRDTVMTRVMQALTPGAIILMHVGSNPVDESTLDADTLPRMIRELRAAGYSFVDLSTITSP
jgi:peptidoglycan/xylan/chitin deacetylase (PgdA/CDA1 family)